MSTSGASSKTKAKGKSARQTPMMAQFAEQKAAYPGKILFFRMGDFYEMFHDDAKVAAAVLGLTLTSRSKDDPIPMAGIPHHAADGYLKRLIDAGHSVAICDQLEDPAQAKANGTGIVKRGVTRVVTPGTLIDDQHLAGSANNFLAAICEDGEAAALACVDVSTGEFFVSTVSLDALADELERLAPAETLASAQALSEGKPLAEILRYRPPGVLTKREGYHFEQTAAKRVLLEHFGVASLDGFDLTDKPVATSAAGGVLQFLQETQKTTLSHIRTIRLIDASTDLILDRTTQRNLELTQPLMGGDRSTTLLAVIDKTRTGPGGRLLKNWLLRPLATVAPIQQRQAAISEMMQDHRLRADLREVLSGIADLERIIARVVTGRATPRDLIALAHSADKLPALANLGEQMQAALLRELSGGIDLLTDVRDIIVDAIVDTPPAQMKDGGVIRPGFHPELDELRAVSTGGKDWIAQFQADEQTRTGIPSLKVGYNRVFGYYIQITTAHKDKVPDDYTRKQTLTNAERYITPALKERERIVLGAEERISQLEAELFDSIRRSVAGFVERVQSVAHALAQLDCLTALAEVGARTKSVIPEIHDGIDTSITAGRHPVMESILPEGEFIPNDVAFDPDTARVLIITGPNMAGKSTYIRQTALLTILAQMGAAIPAEAARIGLADRIFTRVGAADDLARGQSTFMVEMSETANILNNATPRSLVILDEVGRGTSTFDGVSLAWAITEYLEKKVLCRTLFATHYHELAELGMILKGAENHNVAVRDWGGEILFLRKIQPGSADRSYGIQVARLAGFPGGVLERAKEILHGLEGQAADRDWNYLKEGEVLRAAARAVQLDLFAPKVLDASKLADDLAAINPDDLTPNQAHAALRKLLKKYGGG